MRAVTILVFSLITLAHGFQIHSASSHTLNNVPQNTPARPRDHARVARQLVHTLDWGVLSTTSVHLDGLPFGNAVSFSDGPIDASTGRLLFYLTKLDATAQDIQQHPNATLTLCAAQIPNACSGIDAEDPTCAKVSITGRIALVPDARLEESKEMLFERHPAMRDWPSGHGFEVYELYVVHVLVLDWYGGAHRVRPEEYYSVRL